MNAGVPRPRVHRPGVRAGVRWISFHVALAAVTVVFGAPLLWLAGMAFAGEGRFGVTLAHLRALFADLDFAQPLRVSLTVAATTTLVTAVTVTLAGYALSRLVLRGKTAVVTGVLLLQTIPLSVTIVPIYDLMRRLDLRNSYLGLILAHAVLGLPFLIWLMKDFFDAIPRALEEGAWVDGASEVRALAGVLLPAARGGVAVVAGYAFLNAWSEVLLALVLVDGARLQTVALAFYETPGSEWGVVAAMAVIYLLPVMLVFALVGRLIVGGLVTSAMGPG